MVPAVANGPRLSFLGIALLTNRLALVAIGMVRTLALWSTTFDISRVLFMA
jgi:hypothetical protein